MKKEKQAPTFDMWMLTELVPILLNEYHRRMKETGNLDALKVLADTHGIKFAKEAEKELQENRFHPCGKIHQMINRIQEMKDVFNIIPPTPNLK